MMTPGQILRLLYIQRVLIRYGLDEIVFSLNLFRPIRFLQYLLPWNWFRHTRAPRAERLRLVLEELGPIYIKFGQLLSTRRDMLPDDVAAEFARLQDKVPPFPGSLARQIIEEAFNKKITDIFLEFNEEPLASASIAQVHSATLKDGREMIVKVVRPNIERNIRRDLGIMHLIAAMAENYSGQVQRLKPTDVVSEFEKTLLDELDLMREAANASQLRRNFEDSELLYVPQVEWHYTRRNVMVMEKIYGIPVGDTRALKNAGVDFKWLAEAGVEIFFTQVFRDSYFHADMHPGNIFVNPGEDGEAARIVVVDFGIMSSLSEFDKRYLADNFMAFLNKDYQKVAELHVQSGWVPPDTRVDEFEFAIRTVCEPLFDRPISEISFGALLVRLFQTARRFNMVIMPQLLLLQKTLLNIEGLGRELYPQLNMWTNAKPVLDRWVKERAGIRGLIKGTRENTPYWLDRLPELPTKVFDLVDRFRDGRLQFEWRQDELRKMREEMREGNRRNVLSIVGATLLIGCFILAGLGLSTEPPGEIPLLAWLLGLSGTLVIYFSLRK
ncbi:MAG: ubiquinone biosynthesis regulatory protein kinase UbiB [Gammaproteobacteria bacterium]